MRCVQYNAAKASYYGNLENARKLLFDSRVDTQKWGKIEKDVLIPKNGKKFPKKTQNWNSLRPCQNSWDCQARGEVPICMTKCIRISFIARVIPILREKAQNVVEGHGEGAFSFPVKTVLSQG